VSEHDDMRPTKERFLREFGNGDWRELEDLEILKFAENELDAERFLRLMEQEGVAIERGNVQIDLGRPDDHGGWEEDLVWEPGFRITGQAEAECTEEAKTLN
jgi:hypothetical protein